MWQGDSEQRAASWVTDGVNIAVHVADDSFADRQAQAGAILAGSAQFDEWLEDPTLLRGGEAVAVVLHVDPAPIRMIKAHGGKIFLGKGGFHWEIRFVPCQFPPDFEGGSPLRLAVANRIGDEFPDDDMDLFLMALNPRHVAAPDVGLGLAQGVRMFEQDTSDETLELDLVLLQGEFSCARIFQQGVDDAAD